MTREVLTADRTLYVRSDALYTDAPGRLDTTDGACQTWQQAINLAAALDFNGYIVTIQHGSEGAHTFTAPNTIPQLTGGGTLAIRGSSTPGNTVLNVPANDCFYVDNSISKVSFAHMTLIGGGNGQIEALYQTTILIGDGMIFGAATFAHLWVHDAQAQVLSLANSYTINGNATYHIGVEAGMFWLEAATVTLTGTPAFSAFVLAQDGGRMRSPIGAGGSFVGSATGSRYAVNTNGVINTAGGGANYFPGNSAGTTATGGQYA